MMDKLSISFIVVALVLGSMIGAVAGSLLAQVFGLDILNSSIMGEYSPVLEDFYIVESLQIRVTPAALLGFIITVALLYKKGKG